MDTGLLLCSTPHNTCCTPSEQSIAWMDGLDFTSATLHPNRSLSCVQDKIWVVHPSNRRPGCAAPQIRGGQGKMGKEKNRNTFDAFKEWFEDHKLRAVGCLWLSGIAASIAYNWSKPEKTSVKIIHARLHAQALTLAALAGAVLVEYYDHKTGAKQERVAKLLDPDVHSQKS